MKKLKEGLKYGKRGITLISLVVTIIVLLILAGVTIATLFGENGIITKALEAKQKTEEAAEKEQQLLAGAFEKNFVTYNGQLHVEGTKLMNEHNEEVRLKGTVLANDKNDKFSKTLLSNLKDKWNNNVIKVGCWSTEAGQVGIYTDEARMQEMYQIIDNAISLDMYVIVIFWSGDNLTDNVQNEAIDYFTQIASRYKDVPNLIYEIANEPSNTWDEIKSYANVLIDTIRSISPNSLIISPVMGNCGFFSNVINSLLEYDNIMYAAHIYYGGQGLGGNAQSMSTAALNGVPIFVSEWSSAIDNTNPNPEATDKFIALMDRYNLSSTFFILNDSNGSLNLIKENMWDETLDDNTLTETGLYAKRFFKGEYQSPNYTIADYTMPSNGNTEFGQYFWNKNYRFNISQIITINTIEMPENIIHAWDLSNGSGNLISYIVDDNTGNNSYILYIACNGEKMYAYDYWRLFSHFENVEKIDLTYLDTTYVSDMSEWFDSCYKLKEIIGLNNFDTSNVTNMSQMFAYCYQLEYLDLSSFKTNNLTNTKAMFYASSNLKELKFNLLEIDSIVSYEGTFTGVASGIIIYVPNVKTANFVFDRLSEYAQNGIIYYGIEDNWTEYIA